MIFKCATCTIFMWTVPSSATVERYDLISKQNHVQMLWSPSQTRTPSVPWTCVRAAFGVAVNNCPSLKWFHSSKESPSQIKSQVPQSHLHCQFGRAHRFPQLVAGPAHINPGVRRLQISQDQRADPVFMLLHGHSGRSRHQLLVLKPLHLRLWVA